VSTLEAIIHESGRQFAVHAGSIIAIDRQGLAPGQEVVFDDVRLLTSADGTTIGRPSIEGAKVIGKVQRAFKGEKVIAYKYRRRKNSATRKGHRQRYTSVRITSVETN